MIACMGDGALPAYGGCVYLIWEYSCPDPSICSAMSCKKQFGGHFTASLVLAKARVTPLRGFTTPRSELSAGVLVSRMAVRVARALGRVDSNESPKSCVFMLDSECTIAKLESSFRSL